MAYLGSSKCSSMMRAWHGQVEMGEVGGVQTESGVGGPWWRVQLRLDCFNGPWRILNSYGSVYFLKGINFIFLLGNHMEVEQLGSRPGYRVLDAPKHRHRMGKTLRDITGRNDTKGHHWRPSLPRMMRRFLCSMWGALHELSPVINTPMPGGGYQLSLFLDGKTELHVPWLSVGTGVWTQPLINSRKYELNFSIIFPFVEDWPHPEYRTRSLSLTQGLFRLGSSFVFLHYTVIEKGFSVLQGNNW